MRPLARLAAVLPIAVLFALLAAPAQADLCTHVGDEFIQRNGTFLFNPDCGNQIPINGEIPPTITDAPDHGTLVRLSEQEEEEMDDEYVYRYTAATGYQGTDQIGFSSDEDDYVIDIEIGLPSCEAFFRKYDIGGAAGALRIGCGDPDGDPVTFTVNPGPSAGTLGAFSFYPATTEDPLDDIESAHWCAMYTPPASGPPGNVPLTLNVSDGHAGGDVVIQDTYGLNLVASGGDSEPTCERPVDPCPEDDCDPGPGPSPGPNGGGSGNPTPPPLVGGGNLGGGGNPLIGGPSAGKSSVGATQKGKAGQVAGSVVVNYAGSTVTETVTGSSGPQGSIAKAVKLGSARQTKVRKGLLRWKVKLTKAGKAALKKGLKRRKKVKVTVVIKVSPPAGSGAKPSTIVAKVTLTR